MFNTRCCQIKLLQPKSSADEQCFEQDKCPPADTVHQGRSKPGHNLSKHKQSNETIKFNQIQSIAETLQASQSQRTKSLPT